MVGAAACFRKPLIVVEPLHHFGQDIVQLADGFWLQFDIMVAGNRFADKPFFVFFFRNLIYDAHQRIDLTGVASPAERLQNVLNHSAFLEDVFFIPQKFALRIVEQMKEC